MLVTIDSHCIRRRYLFRIVSPPRKTIKCYIHLLQQNRMLSLRAFRAAMLKAAFYTHDSELYSLHFYISISRYKLSKAGGKRSNAA